VSDLEVFRLVGGPYGGLLVNAKPFGRLLIVYGHKGEQPYEVDYRMRPLVAHWYSDA
jgi:hypothetical protein